MRKTKKYDFIIPIGWGCLNAHNLRLNKLQRESLPFDWIWISSIKQVSTLLKNNFQDFLLKENLQFIKSNGDADVYRDSHNAIEYWHDFMVGEEFEASYLRNYQKYQRRIKRMFHHIQKAHKILWVRIERIFPNQEKTDDKYMFIKETLPEEQVIEEFKEIQNLYPHKQCDMLLLYTYDTPCDKKEYDITPFIHVCEFYNDESLGWQGDMPAITKILSPYALTIKSRIKYGMNTLAYRAKKLLFSRKFNKKNQ